VLFRIGVDLGSALGHETEEDVEESVHLAPVLGRPLGQLLDHMHQEADANSLRLLLLDRLHVSHIVSETLGHSLLGLSHGSVFFDLLELAESVLNDTSEALLSGFFSALKQDFPEDLRVRELAHLAQESLGDLRARFEDLQHHISETIHTWVDEQACQDFKTDLCANLHPVILRGLVTVAISDALQDAHNEIEELCAVDVALKSELLVVFSHLRVDRVGELTVSS